MMDKPRPSKQQPRVWILEVDRVPTLAFEAMNHLEAKQMAREQWLKEDLAGQTSEGVPLWTSGQKLSVRPPTEDERAAYQDGAKVGEAHELVMVYLRPLDGTEDEDLPH